MKKTIMTVVITLNRVMFGLLATLVAGILLTYGCMKMYDIFWNPASISVQLTWTPEYAIMFGIMTMNVVVEYFMFKAIKKMEDKPNKDEAA